jgi:hypothetical protein
MPGQYGHYCFAAALYSAAGHTVQSPMQRPPSIFHYASSRKLLSDLASAAETPQAFDAMFLVRSDLASDRFCTTEFQMRD